VDVCANSKLVDPFRSVGERVGCAEPGDNGDCLSDARRRSACDTGQPFAETPSAWPQQVLPKLLRQVLPPDQRRGLHCQVMATGVDGGELWKCLRPSWRRGGIWL
jgi:hypothetical protein